VGVVTAQRLKDKPLCLQIISHVINHPQLFSTPAARCSVHAARLPKLQTCCLSSSNAFSICGALVLMCKSGDEAYPSFYPVEADIVFLGGPNLSQAKQLA
jgi:hypothetical protein